VIENSNCANSQTSSAFIPGTDLRWGRQCGRRGKWLCVARCNMQNPTPKLPCDRSRVGGKGIGKSRQQAESLANSDANNNTKIYNAESGNRCVKKHCDYDCRKV